MALRLFDKTFGRHLGSVSGFGVLAQKYSHFNRVDLIESHAFFLFSYHLKHMCRVAWSRVVPFPYSSKRRRHRVPNVKLVVRVLEALRTEQKSA